MKLFSIFSLTLLTLFAQTADAVTSNPLKFFSNWFLTGDYASAGVGLRNTAGVGTLNMSNVPCISGTGAAAALVPCTTSGSVPAYPIAAFLYWETVENTPAAAAVNGTFDGYPIVGQLIGSDNSSACWLPPNQTQTLRVYRADVLRDLLIDPASNIRLANGAHPVAVGNGIAANKGVLLTEGRAWWSFTAWLRRENRSWRRSGPS
jgi:hypothetical protein